MDQSLSTIPLHVLKNRQQQINISIFSCKCAIRDGVEYMANGEYIPDRLIDLRSELEEIEAEIESRVFVPAPTKVSIK